MKIRDLVKNKRKQLGESQREFGKRFNLSHAAISDMERGVTTSIDDEMLNFVMDKNSLPEFVLRRCGACDGKGFFMDIKNV